MNDLTIIPAIVVVGYNRRGSLERVLQSVVNAEYEYDDIKLIVSLDHSEAEGELVQAAERYREKWTHGTLEIRTTKKRMGLRNHILKCGDITNEYGAVIILEDDIIVSPYFYDYVVQAVNRYKDEEMLAGVALYSHKWNGYVRQFFEPLQDGSDCYLGQFSVTWGQCWTQKQWKSFKNWYSQNQKLKHRKDVPEHIHNWPETSWGKYFVHYIVEKNKYYLMPYVSLATNFSDAGQHIKVSSTEHQVPLLYGKKIYHFPESENAIKYDIFFENQNLGKYLLNKTGGKEICVNLYGDKYMGGYEFALTKRQLPYHIVQSFALQMQSQELNVYYNISGEDIFLYDLRKKERNKQVGSFFQRYKILDYNVKYISFKNAMIYSLFRFKESLHSILKRLGRKR